MCDYAELVTRLKQSDDNCNAECYECSGECLSSGCNIFSEAADAIEELLDELTTIRKQFPRWISVEERLPEVVVDVLVTDGSNVCISRQVRYVSPTERFTFWSRDDLDLTHWMPLPEPPKGVE